MKAKIAVLDDEEDIRELIRATLEKENYEVALFERGKEFYETLAENQIPDLLILDLMLPDVDGMEVCRFLRSQERTRDIPIIMLTAKTREADKVLGLEIGADDYITKPFSTRELKARVKAVLRRAERGSSERRPKENQVLEIDEEKFEVRIEGKKVYFTATEFHLLKILARKKGRVYTREQLLDLLWGNDKFVIDRTIDVHIRHIRKKLGKYGSLIKSVPGIGYKMEEDL